MAARSIFRLLIFCLYLVAGCFHLADPAPFLSITPTWVIYPRTVILITGIWEIAGSLALLWPRSRHVAGVGLALYAVCVYLANIKHAFDTLSAAHVTMTAWAHHIPRLGFQPVLVWAALYAAELLSWPFWKTSRSSEKTVADQRGAASLPRPLKVYLSGGDALPSLTDGSRPQMRRLPSSATKAESPSSPGRARTPSSSALAIPAFSRSGIAD